MFGCSSEDIERASSRPSIAQAWEGCREGQGQHGHVLGWRKGRANHGSAASNPTDGELCWGRCHANTGAWGWERHQPIGDEAEPQARAHGQVFAQSSTRRVQGSKNARRLRTSTSSNDNEASCCVFHTNA